MTPGECEAALRDTLPNFAFDRITRDVSGRAFCSFVIDDEWVARFPRDAAAAEQLARELALLPTLAARLPVPIPRYEHRGEWQGAPFGVHRSVEGNPLDPGSSPGDADLARKIGELLTALHGFPPEMATSRWDETDADALWLKRHRAFQAACAEQVFPILTPRDQMTASDLFKQFNAAFCHPGTGLTLTHSDFAPAHVLAEDGELRGVVEWSHAAIADPAIDFAGLLAGVSSTWLHLVIEYYDRPTGDRFMDRVRYYHRVAPLHDILHGSTSGDRAIVRAGVKAFAARTRQGGG